MGIKHKSSALKFGNGASNRLPFEAMFGFAEMFAATVAEGGLKSFHTFNEMLKKRENIICHIALG